MGQSQSHNNREPVVRRPPPRPIAPPTARPVSDLGPKGPSYTNPNNKVLPTVLPKPQLRPVSQELSQFHPDYKDIFMYNEDEDEDDDESVNKQFMNGSVPRSNGIPITNGHAVNSETGSVASDSSSSGRQNSVSMDPSRKYKVHRRQQSATSSLYSRENTIIEHPQESLELRGKLDSMSTSCPQVSIPVKSTFEMDSSLNMTYAQLAEARRNKTLTSVEQKTGKRIEDLSNDLLEHVSRPVTNLVRSNSTKSTKSSVGVDVKKKKRAPAPPTQRPPAPPAPTSSQSAPSTPRGPIRSVSHTGPKRPANPPPVYTRGYSVDNEPPVDYDTESPRHSPDFWKDTSASVPPPPPLQGILKKDKQRPYSRGNSVEYADQVRERKPPSRQSSQRVPPIVPPVREEDPLLLEIQKLAKDKAARRQISENLEKEKEKEKEKERELEREKEKELEKEKEKENEQGAETADESSSSSDITEPSLIFSSGNVKPVLQKQSAVEENHSTVPAAPPPASVDTIATVKTSTLERKPSTTSVSSANSQQGSEGAMRRLSSLLQHDIKIAAQAKATKIVKHTTPVREKPKDPTEVFRQELEKAALEREKRSKTEMSIDEKMKKKREEENNVPVTGRVVEKQNTAGTLKTNEAVDKKEKEMAEKEKPKEVITLDRNNDFPKTKFLKKSERKESMDVKKEGSVRQRVPDPEPEEDEDSKDIRNTSTYTREDWIPEDDLDSDDNLSDKDVMMTSRGGTQGFKSTIIPGKVNDLKTNEKKGKSKKYTKKNSDSSSDDKRKYDSIKRFKKSVHKSVKSAFGSISKAGGKIIKRQKSEDFDTMNEPPPPPPQNWKLRNSVSAPGCMDENLESEKAFKYMVPNGFSDHHSDTSDEEEYEYEEVKPQKEVGFKNEENHSEDEDSEKEDFHHLKRAGVAYIGKKGQIVVLPEYETVGKDKITNGEFEGHAPKIYQKKKKFAFDATVRKKEREKKEEMIKEDINREEQKREEERRKGLEAEKELKKMREMEARERLQRLETQAQIQQQFLQQQQQQMGILTVPPLPPPAGFQQGYNPSVDYSQLLAQTSLPQPSLNLPYGSQPMFANPVYPGMSNMSLGDISDYMRMMQNSTPNPQQQYAFMLNSVNLTNPGMLHMLGQDTSKYFPTKSSSQEYLDSDRNQVFNNWVGPTKQQASKANVVPSQSSISANPVSVGRPRSTSHTGGQIRTNIMFNDDESDTSDGLSPQNAALASVTAQGTALDPTGPTIISGVGNDGGHRTKISINGGYNPRGVNRQTSFSSVSSQPGSETSAER